ncbi:MAG TPA: hypothetical protein VFP72_05975 [Kineosporiaceae bacterium]|nr:hypothetical protein [Kineosporiaceae bacterium]
MLFPWGINPSADTAAGPTACLPSPGDFPWLQGGIGGGGDGDEEWAPRLGEEIPACLPTSRQPCGICDCMAAPECPLQLRPDARAFP